MKKTDEKILKRNKKLRKAWCFSLALNAVFSFTIPFLTALSFFLVSDDSLPEIFGRASDYALTGVLMFFTLSFFSGYLFVHNREVFLRKSSTLLTGLTVLFSFCTAPLFSQVLTPYVMPLLFCGLLVSVLIDNRFGSLVASVLPVLFFFCYSAMNPSVDTFTLIASMTVQAVAGNCIVLATKTKYTRGAFLSIACLVGLVVALPLAVLFTAFGSVDGWRTYLVNGAFSFASVLIGLAEFMLLEPVFEFLFGMYSSFRLEEICSPSAPLLERLASEAPGTYNHSIAMSILAQDCAKAIGENAALAKAGACYHDIGKLIEPICFTENQTDYNPHDDYIPEVSVSIITKHTKAGADTIRKNGLPEAVARIAEEHHGDQPVTFFLNKTRGMTEQKVSIYDYSYKGPKPSTKISGIIMIVDTVEAATRAEGMQKDEKERQAFIHKLIMDKMENGQFSDCPLTLRDFTVIEETLVRKIPGIYHQRIKYTK